MMTSDDNKQTTRRNGARSTSEGGDGSHGTSKNKIGDGVTDGTKKYATLPLRRQKRLPKEGDVRQMRWTPLDLYPTKLPI